ncbi:MAG: 2-hydroxyacyl-CoA dehydratase [Candidatus Helarchaeota archaeon]|nr:2-hydroxyacyl-CoA dehydratase [Candidatus Helarchaeota archaeon]
MASYLSGTGSSKKIMDKELYKKYRKTAKDMIPKGQEFSLWKGMFSAMLGAAKDQPLEPFLEMMLNVFIDVGKARTEGKPIVMHTFNYGPEIFYALDVQPLMQELFSVGLSPVRMNEFYIDLTDEMGFGDNPTICNASRPLIGAYFKKAAPIPDLLVFTSTPCNSIAITYQVYQQLCKCPAFVMDIPYWEYDKTREQFKEFYDEKTLGYVLDQSKNLVSWLEKHTKQKLNEEKFKQTMVWLNQARQNIMEFNELLKAVPCPVNSTAGFTNWFTMSLCGGTSAAVEVTKSNRDTAAANVKNKVAGVPDEKIRIAWPYIHVFFDAMGLFPYLEQNFNAVAIMDLLGFYPVQPHDTSTLEKSFESLAKGTLDLSMVGSCRGPAEFYIDYVVRWVKDYKCDCVVVPMQFACKHNYSMLRLMAEVVKEETGIPTLIFGCDPFDAREVPAETIRGRIAEFLTEVVL